MQSASWEDFLVWQALDAVSVLYPVISVPNSLQGQCLGLSLLLGYMWTEEYFDVRETCAMRMSMLGFIEKAGNSSEMT